MQEYIKLYLKHLNLNWDICLIGDSPEDAKWIHEGVEDFDSGYYGSNSFNIYSQLYYTGYDFIFPANSKLQPVSKLQDAREWHSDAKIKINQAKNIIKNIAINEYNGLKADYIYIEGRAKNAAVQTDNTFKSGYNHTKDQIRSITTTGYNTLKSNYNSAVQQVDRKVNSFTDSLKSGWNYLFN